MVPFVPLYRKKCPIKYECLKHWYILNRRSVRFLQVSREIMKVEFVFFLLLS